MLRDIGRMMDLSPLYAPGRLNQIRVAVLVDGDNFPHAELARLEAEASRFGEVVIRRVFGDVKRVGGWPESAGYQMLHCDSSSGRKNLSDMHLTVAAMDMAQRGLAQGFVIASDDRDFDPVAQFLIETGRAVLRVRRVVPIKQPVEAKVTVPTPKLSILEQQISAAISECKDKTGLLLTDLNIQMRHKYQTKISDTVEKSWHAYLAARPTLFVCDPRGPNARARLKRP